MTDVAPSDRTWRRLSLAAVLLFTVALGARGITDEASVMLGGDMARYLMNGVFLHDLAAAGGAWSLHDLTSFAERYYARYPALSLGHHPPLPYFSLVPFYAIFGISVFAARVAELFWFLLAAWGMYAVARRMFGWQAASWATLLLVTNPLTLRYGQRLLSEMPMLALVLVAVNLLLRYCETRRLMDFVWFVIAVAASLHGKQLAVFMFPVYGVILVSRLGWKALLNRRMLLMTGAGLLLVAPLVLMTLGLSPANVGIAARQATRLVSGVRRFSVLTILTAIFTTHLSLPAMLVTVAGAAVLIAQRNRQLLVVLAWLIAGVGGSVVFAGGIEPARYAFAAMPAYFLLAGGLVAGATTTRAKTAGAIVLAGVVGWQSWLVKDVRPTGAGGYEAAAEYVLAHSREPVVLFDTPVDTGYFVFYVRKHDPGGRLVLLRADKLLVPLSRRPNVPGSPGWDPSEIYDTLQKFGVHYIVIEERDGGALVLRQLHDDLKTSRFVERQRIPIVTGEPQARGLDLVIYEFLDARPADPDAELDIDIPLGNREIKLRLRDLIASPAR